MVPEDGRSWNYNFRGVEHSETMSYGVELGVPLEFYDETHRPNHFMNFGEEIGDASGGDERIEFEDYLS